MKIPRQKPTVRRSADEREITVYAIIVRVPGAINGDKVPIKVGCSAKPKELLKHIALFCPYPVEMVSIGILPGPALVSRVMNELRRALEMASVEMLKERGDWYFSKPEAVESVFGQTRLNQKLKLCALDSPLLYAEAVSRLHPRMESQMELYKFSRQNGSRTALTADRQGGNLPQDGVPWKFISTVKINEGDQPRIGADAKTILETIKASGIFFYP